MVIANMDTRAIPTRRLPLELTLRNSMPKRWQQFPASPLQWDVGTVIAKTLLDHVQEGLRNGIDSGREAMRELFAGLYSLKSTAEPEVWRSVAQQCVNHPVIELIHQDPFTARSFKKPRGYAGDAVLIDYIYTGNPRIVQDQPVSELGEMIFEFTTGAPASAGVRTRRDIMAAIIDETCSVTEQPHVLSIACGHLREATLCRSVADGKVGRFVALDQDELSLGVVGQTAECQGVVPVCSSIKTLFRGGISDQKFDLIYSTGLYDYLDDRIATKLTSRLFNMLNPGGRVVIANFLPEIWCAGFMETFMGWSLIYRSAEQFLRISDDLPIDEVMSRRTFSEKNANIVFLDVRKR